MPSVLLVVETAVPGKIVNLPQVTDKLLSHDAHLAMNGDRTHDLSCDRY